MKILVTGGAGFIGSHLVDRLIKEGHKPMVFDKKQGKDINNSGQLSRAVRKNKFDGVVHLAAEAGVRRSFEQPQLYFQTNVNGTLNLLECLRQSPKTGFVLASSSSVYGNSASVPFKETETNLAPVSPYAVSKLTTEQISKIYADNYGLQTTILRLFTVYGPRNRQDMAAFTFTRDIIGGKPIKLFGQETMRDFTYIDDIVEGIIRAIERPFKFEIINLGNAKPLPVRELIRLIGQAADKKPKVIVSSLPAGDVNKTWADINKAKRLLGWQPTIDIKTGIEKLVEWYKLRS